MIYEKAEVGYLVDALETIGSNKVIFRFCEVLETDHNGVRVRTQEGKEFNMTHGCYRLSKVKPSIHQLPHQKHPHGAAIDVVDEVMEKIESRRIRTDDITVTNKVPPVKETYKRYDMIGFHRTSAINLLEESRSVSTSEEKEKLKQAAAHIADCLAYLENGIK